MIPELSGRDLHFKKDIQLLITSCSCFRQPEETPDIANCVCCSKQKRRLASPVCLVRVEHIRHCYRVNNVGSRLHCSCNRNGLGLQSRRGYFRDEHPADWTDGHLPEECVYIKERCQCPHRRVIVGRKGEETDDKKENSEDYHSGIVNRSTAELFFSLASDQSSGELWRHK